MPGASSRRGQTPDEPTLYRARDIAGAMGGGAWRRTLFHDGRNEVALLGEAPRAPASRERARPRRNDFWFVIEGEYEFALGALAPIRAGAGDVVACPAGLQPSARVVGDSHGLRVGVYGLDDWERDAVGGGAPFPADRRQPPNMLHTRTADLLAGSDQRRFTIVEDDRNTLYLIRVPPGDVSHAHWHYDFDEWWIIADGELEFEIGEGRPTLQARAGDIVLAPRGFRHRIATHGQTPSMRMPVTTPDNAHIWTDDDSSAPPPRR